jgi:hypothetical protein
MDIEQRANAFLDGRHIGGREQIGSGSRLDLYLDGLGGNLDVKRRSCFVLLAFGRLIGGRDEIGCG